MERPRLRTALGSVGGFTLFEILVVLVIIALAAGIAAPRWVAALPGIQMASAARRTAAIFRYAGSSAVSEQRVYSVSVATAPGTLSLAPVMEPGGFGPKGESPESEGIKTYQLPDDIVIQGAFNGMGERAIDLLTVFFYPDGGNSGAKLVLAGTRGRRLEIDLDFITGDVKIRDASQG
ncbi:MAG: prepilin-type N-terminal cleavage/methylation domain-containing protein [Desulfobacterales bacterium]